MDLTGVDISDYDLGAFVCEESCCFRADALACAGDDGYLACQETGRVVQVLVNLVETVEGSHFGNY